MAAELLAWDESIEVLQSYLPVRLWAERKVQISWSGKLPCSPLLGQMWAPFHWQVTTLVPVAQVV